jgi:hypothetical protein
MNINNDPIPVNYSSALGGGCLPQPYDWRDITLGDIPFTPDPNAPTWEQGFDNEVKYGKLKREHQGSSLSCVGQGWSKYLEMINLAEEGHVDDLSARDIYSQIWIKPDGAAYIRDGAKIAVNIGNCEERFIPSYKNGQPPTEQFMRTRPNPDYDCVANAYIYHCKRFVYLPTSFPLTADDWEAVRQVIWQFKGFVSGYRHHCMYGPAYGLLGGKKAIRFSNSYGEGSDLWYVEGAEYPLYDITFLVDLPNPPEKINMYKVVKSEIGKDQVIITGSNEGYVIPDIETRNFLVTIKSIPDSEPEIISNADYLLINILGKYPSKKLMDVLEPVVRDIYLSE